MVTEDKYIEYVKKLASAHIDLQHGVNGVSSFFEIEDEENFGNFDDALRNATARTVMLLVAAEGELDDNGCDNHTQEMDCQFYILQKKRAGVTIPQIRSACIVIIKEILGRMKSDARSNKIVVGKNITFLISKVPYRKVGPMNLDWYGYTVMIRFTCPFGYTVDSGTWTDI